MDIEILGKQKAQDAVDFIKALKHVKDPWSGVFFTLLEWQERILRDVYGTLKADGTRQYKHVYIEIPKKQGKSEMLAAIGIKQLCADDEYSAEVYGCAVDKQQASIIYDVACEMINQEPELQAVCKIIASKKRIVYLPTKSFYQVLSAESYSKHGLNVSTVLFDELHAQPNRDLYDVMSFGSGDARRQPLYWYISTAGKDPDRTSVGWELHQKAVDILLGNRADAIFYPVIFGYDSEEKRLWHGWGYKKLDESVTWESEDVWRAVNPSIDHTVALDTMREGYQSIKGNPAGENLFQQLRLNVWVKYKHAKWLPVEVWEANNGLIDLEKLRGRKCYGGLDLSSKLDISSFVLVFSPEKPGDKYILLPHFWIPEDNMEERVKRDKVKYDVWARQGLLTTTPGNVIDYNFIRQAIIGQRDVYDIQEIGYDPWNAMQLAIDLENEGLTMVEIRQGFKSLSPPMKELEAFLKGRHINHGNNPILRWMFGNVEVKIDENDNIRPVRGKGIERIDGIMALIIAMARVIVQEDTTSVYETRDSFRL